MDQFQTSEGKLLYITYNLYKSNRIGIEQKNEIKGEMYKQIIDMLIAKDFRIQQVMQEIKNETNLQKIERMLENINPEEHSPRDIDDNLSHTYKQKRPKLFKFQKSNFSKYIEAKANEDTDTFSSSNKQLEFRQRLYSLAADSC